MNPRITRESVLSFLLTHIVIEQNRKLELDQLRLFQLNTLAAQAEALINKKEDLIPHEVIEELALDFLSELE